MIRHQKDKQFDLPAGSVRLEGFAHEKIRTVCEGTLKAIDMKALADYFRNTADMFATGEFWGKIMRASCLICGYTGDPALRKIVDRAAADMLSIQRPDGCISTCPDATQPKGTNGSDLWERKYVLMGLLSYYELTGSEAALEACVRLIRYTNAQVGPSPKTPITETGWAFGGMESSSILEPVMRVYHITGEPAALALGTYIVESGCCSRENIFAAIRAGKNPRDIGWNGEAKESIAKAYEMMSCFEGLCEYYRAVGNPEDLETVRLFWERVKEQEITLLGSGGADGPFNLGPGTGEQWNNTRNEQTNPDIDLMMETCVTVYWMRLCHQLLRLTGEVKYADAMEVSLYNALYGALRPDGRFFEYFPRFNGARNPKVNYSFNIKGFDLSCCTANGPTGLGMAPYLAFTGTPDGVAVNLYETGEARIPFGSGAVTLSMVSQFPRVGYVRLKVAATEGRTDGFAIDLRVPGYVDSFAVMDAQNPAMSVRGKPGTYLRITDDMVAGKEWLICMDYAPVRHRAPHGSNRAGDNFVAFTYGPLLLSRDSRDCDDPLAPVPDGEVGDFRILVPERPGFLTAQLSVGDQVLTMVDYMSAGNGWDGGTFASWLPICP
ncbi:MAG: beta-L-arabinofuranosidase domain-containing protein [Eubacteriales bacterium]